MALETRRRPRKDEETVPPQGDVDPAPHDGRRWYVIHTYSGYENKVKADLERRIASMDARNQIFQVVIPTEEEIEIKDGQRRMVQRKRFPGYVLVDMIELQEGDDLSNKTWYVVRNTPGVTGFVGSGNRPIPLEQAEVKQILRQMKTEEPRVKVNFTLGERVRIIDGPFVDFNGNVDDINAEKGKVKVLVSFFGRETPVELDFLQVERVWVDLSMGDRVRIIDGPFVEFSGTIETINAAGTLIVTVMFFGRRTAVELQRRQVEPLDAQRN